MIQRRELTPERENKFRKVLEKRQPDLTVVLENVHDPHNISAVMRSCDAVGVHEIYILNTNIELAGKLGHRSSASAKKWLKVHRFHNLDECVASLREKGYSIWATHLSKEAKQLYEMDLTQKTALVFGNEHSGISEEMLAVADGNFIIPMHGMIPSLNISVAAAVSLYEALRQREIAGRYARPMMQQHEITGILQGWLEREQARKRRK